MPVKTHPGRKFPVREVEQPLAVSLQGTEAETPELWVDLIEFVLDAVRREGKEPKYERGTSFTRHAG